MNFVGAFERLSPLTNLTNNEWEKLIEVNVINAKNDRERTKLLQQIQNDPGVRKPPKMPSFSSQASISPIMREATSGINKSKSKIDSELSGKNNKEKRDNVKDDIKNAQSKIDTPSEFVF